MRKALGEFTSHSGLPFVVGISTVSLLLCFDTAGSVTGTVSQ